MTPSVVLLGVSRARYSASFPIGRLDLLHSHDPQAHPSVVVCKLFCKYESGDGELVGSGILITNDMIITAGHVGYDWGTHERGNCGALISVKVYIGHDGQHFLQHPSYVRRYGRFIAVPTDWVERFVGSKDFGIVSKEAKKPVPVLVTGLIDSSRQAIRGCSSSWIYGYAYVWTRNPVRNWLF